LPTAFGPRELIEHIELTVGDPSDDGGATANIGYSVCPHAGHDVRGAASGAMATATKFSSK
jgi:hypothetical protein